MNKKRKAHNAIVWTAEMLAFLKNNYDKLTNPQLAEALGLRLTTTRSKLLELGLKRMEMEYWTDEMIAYLKANYQTTGDTELAEYFQKNCPKNKPWIKQHIEKKRRYLALKRTQAEIEQIFIRNKTNGVFKKCSLNMWKTRGIAADGDIRFWKIKGRDTPFIKINGQFKHWAHYTWEQAYGKIPKGMNVCYISPPNSDNLSIQNLKLCSDSEVMTQNSEASQGLLSDNYVIGTIRMSEEDKEILRSNPEIIELKRNILKIKRIIKHGKSSNSN